MQNWKTWAEYFPNSSSNYRLLQRVQQSSVEPWLKGNSLGAES
jgi:hypothetical protein